MISGLWANSNLDDGKSTRKQALQEIQDDFESVVELVYHGDKSEEMDLKKDPFFAAMKVPEIPGEQESRPVLDRTTTTEREVEVDQA